MKILVTGGSGFIGSHVVDTLLEAGHSVTNFDIRESPYPSRAAFFKGDITRPEIIRQALTEADVVYHLAAMSDINLVKDNPLKTIEYNIMGTAYLLEECRRKGIERFILASSVYAYSRRGHLYTTAKATSEALCRDYHELYGLPYTILRYGTAYGPRSRLDDVVSIFTIRALNGEDLVIQGTGKQERHFIYVEDLARGSAAALAPAAANGTYTLRAPEATSIEQLAQVIQRLFGPDLKIAYRPSRQDDYLGDVEDPETTGGNLDWAPAVSLEEGIRRFAVWYQSTVART